jgi:hypothetical protein
MSTLLGLSLTLLLQTPHQLWKSAKFPANGVAAADNWVFSSIERASDPASAGFSTIEISECQQMAVDALMFHCVRELPLDPKTPNEVRAILRPSLEGWACEKVAMSGIIWIVRERSDQKDRVVAALPRQTCTELARLQDWTSHALEISGQSSFWLVPAVLTAFPDSSEIHSALLREAINRLRAIAQRSAWPEGYLLYPRGVSQSECSTLGLGELGRLLELRPGDPVVLGALSERCESLGLKSLRAELVKVKEALGWPRSALAWAPFLQEIDCAGLPSHLVAIVRSGGAIPASAAPASVESIDAARAYKQSPPDLESAERLAVAAARQPIPDALNLLAALRLAKDDATVSQLAQALAFAHQARNLEPRHPYADVNVVRALQRLGKSKEALTELKSLPPVSVGSEDSWRAKQIKALQKGLDELSH